MEAAILNAFLVRVDLVVRAVEERDLHVDHRVAGEHAARQRFLEALLDRRDVFARDRAALDLVDELEALAGFGLDLEHHVAVLAAAARLLHELALDESTVLRIVSR
jgi:hypothetical protein